MKLMLTLLALAIPVAAFSERSSYGGTGCPDGTAQIIEKKDGGWEIALASYAVDLSNNSLSREGCAVAIPISVPAGKIAKLGEVILHGDNDLVADTSASLSIDAFFTGDRSSIVENVFEGPLKNSFSVPVSPNALSSCGKATILRVNTGVLLQTSKKTFNRSKTKVTTITIAPLQFTNC